MVHADGLGVADDAQRVGGSCCSGLSSTIGDELTHHSARSRCAKRRARPALPTSTSRCPVPATRAGAQARGRHVGEQVEARSSRAATPRRCRGRAPAGGRSRCRTAPDARSWPASARRGSRRRSSARARGGRSRRAGRSWPLHRRVYAVPGTLPSAVPLSQWSHRRHERAAPTAASSRDARAASAREQKRGRGARTRRRHTPTAYIEDGRASRASAPAHTCGPRRPADARLAAPELVAAVGVVPVGVRARARSLTARIPRGNLRVGDEEARRGARATGEPSAGEARDAHSVAHQPASSHTTV